jgi:hypothetical protein
LRADGEKWKNLTLSSYGKQFVSSPLIRKKDKEIHGM